VRKEKKFVTLLSNMLIKHLILRNITILIFVALSYYVINQTFIQHVFVNQERQMLRSIRGEIKHEIREINYKMEEVVDKALLLQSEHNNLFKNQQVYSLEIFNPLFKVHENGAYYKLLDDGGGSLYYSKSTSMTEGTLHKALLTEWMDLSFKSLVDNDPLIEQVYFNSYDGMNRIYPFIDDLPSIYGPILNIQNYNFYYLADETNNPGRGPMWTTAYLDPANKGWMVSCIVPIYNGDFLEGVTGLDITIEKLVNRIFDIELPVDSNVFVVDQNGIIVAMDENMEDLIQLEELKNVIYKTNIENTIIKPDNYNIYKHSDINIRQKFITLFEKGVNEVKFDNTDYYFNKVNVSTTGWVMMVLTKKSLLLESAELLKRELEMNIGFIVIAILMTIILSAKLFYKNIRYFSEEISMPLKQLSEQVEKFGTSGIEIEKGKTTGISEIDVLKNNFHKMACEIKNRTEELVETRIKKYETEVEMKDYIIKATTDSLTKIYNRRKIDDVMKVEIDRSKRYSSIFSVIILDIDFFKEINDEHGHQIGDEVLVNLSQVLKNCIESSDIVARWGGDEFMIFTIGNNEEKAYYLAEKIRKIVFENKFSHDENVSVSVGVAEVDINCDNARILLHKADMALYEAKSQGRNRVVKYSEINNDLDVYKGVRKRV